MRNFENIGPLSESQIEQSNGKRKYNEYLCKPILLIIDDFDRCLETPHRTQILSTIKEDKIAQTMEAVVRFFATERRRSFLVITSRYRFTLGSEGSGLQNQLYMLALPLMNEREVRKQILTRSLHRNLKREQLNKILDQASNTIFGNPGLEALLVDLFSRSEVTGRSAIKQLVAFGQVGRPPELPELQTFFPT